MMKKSLYILLLIVTPVLIYAGADILKLSARSQNGNIVIFWQSSSESNLKNYVVERKMNEKPLTVVLLKLEQFYHVQIKIMNLLIKQLSKLLKLCMFIV